MTSRPGLRAWLAPHMVGLHLFSLAAIALCVLMGMWQLGVYDDRQASARSAGAHEPAVPLADVWAPDELLTSTQNQRLVAITGEFLPADQQFWVRPKDQDGREGAWLVAPIRTRGAVLLVVRGWTAEDTTLPAVPSGTVTVEGILMPSESSAASWHAENRSIGSVRVAAMINVFSEPLWNGWALGQDDSLAEGLEVVPAPETSVSWLAGGRNLGYGLQWWVFAAFVVFMWWRMGTEKIRSHRGLA